ncbi:MAG: hypothetical protein ACREVL_02875 [Solimonas sp.]
MRSAKLIAERWIGGVPRPCDLPGRSQIKAYAFGANGKKRSIIRRGLPAPATRIRV